MERFSNPENIADRHEGVIELDPYRGSIILTSP